MKRVTSATIWNDAAGRRLSVTYSEIDETSHKVVRDNVRENFIITNTSDLESTGSVLTLAQSLLSEE